jgi:hypothetical protein
LTPRALDEEKRASSGERPVLRQEVLEGDPGLSI